MSEIRILAASALLACGIAAAVAAGMDRLGERDRPAIATVRLAELVTEHARKTAATEASEEDAAKAARRWGGQLETALASTAQRYRVVILPARAVAAGAPDLTDEIRRLIAETAAVAGNGR